jgi:hypothetical protein
MFALMKMRPVPKVEKPNPTVIIEFSPEQHYRFVNEFCLAFGCSEQDAGPFLLEQGMNAPKAAVVGQFEI